MPSGRAPSLEISNNQKIPKGPILSHSERLSSFISLLLRPLTKDKSGEREREKAVEKRRSRLIWRSPGSRERIKRDHKDGEKNWNFHIKEIRAWLIRLIYHFEENDQKKSDSRRMRWGAKKLPWQPSSNLIYCRKLFLFDRPMAFYAKRDALSYIVGDIKIFIVLLAREAIYHVTGVEARALHLMWNSRVQRFNDVNVYVTQ